MFKTYNSNSVMTMLLGGEIVRRYV